MDVLLAVFLARLTDPLVIGLAVGVTLLAWFGLRTSARSEAHLAAPVGAVLAAGVAELLLAAALPGYRFQPLPFGVAMLAALVWALAALIAADRFTRRPH